MHTDTTPQTPGRTVGFDSHPDSFTAAVLQGQTPAQAVVENIYHKVPLKQLTAWAQKHLRADDRVVLEASGNSFQVVRTLMAAGFQAQVLESCHLGKLKEAHANNDRISAVRIGKAYLAGTAKLVWLPDVRTQERRDVMHAHRKAVKRFTQAVNRLDSYLSDNGVRLENSLTQLDEPTALKHIGDAREWSAPKWSIIESYLAEVQSAAHIRQKWERAMALEVIADPILLSLVRLTGVRDIVAFYLGAVIGDIQRFKRAKSLVKYFGLDPAFDDSGNEQWSGGIGGHGHKMMRSVLMQSAQCILRTDRPLAKWGRQLMARKGSHNLSAAAVARKLTVSIWYLLQGKDESVERIDRSMSLKLGKIISKVGAQKMKEMGTNRKQLRQQMEYIILKGRVYSVDPNRTSRPERSSKMTTLAEEYGLR